MRSRSAELHNAFTTAASARHIQSLVNFEDRATVSAAGGLLNHLSENGLMEHHADTSALALASIQPFALGDFAWVDAKTLTSLALFNTDEHPALVRVRASARTTPHPLTPCRSRSRVRGIQSKGSRSTPC